MYYLFFRFCKCIYVLLFSFLFFKLHNYHGFPIRGKFKKRYFQRLVSYTEQDRKSFVVYKTSRLTDDFRTEYMKTPRRQ